MACLYHMHKSNDWRVYIFIWRLTFTAGGCVVDIRFGSPPCCKNQLYWDPAHPVHASINSKGGENREREKWSSCAQERRYTLNYWMSRYWLLVKMTFYSCEPPTAFKTLPLPKLSKKNKTKQDVVSRLVFLCYWSDLDVPDSYLGDFGQQNGTSRLHWKLHRFYVVILFWLFANWHLQTKIICS